MYSFLLTIQMAVLCPLAMKLLAFWNKNMD